MYSDETTFTLEEVYASLTHYIQEYAEMHCVWFMHEGEDLETLEENFVSSSADSNLYRCVAVLYDYVFHRHLDTSLLKVDLQHEYYPYVSPPDLLNHCVNQLFRFWYQFVTSGSYRNPFFSPTELPLATLAIEAYLRYRIDFAAPGMFIKGGLTNIEGTEDGSHAAFETVPSLFTLGEIQSLTGINDSTLRSKIKSKGYILPLYIDEGITMHSSGKINEQGARTMSNNRRIPNDWRLVFDRNTLSGIQKLADHRDVLLFISSAGSYKPTQLSNSDRPDKNIPDYSDSALVYQAISQWIAGNPKYRVSMEDVGEFLGCHENDRGGKNLFMKRMSKGKVALSLPTILFIDKFMQQKAGAKSPALLKLLSEQSHD